MAGFVERLRQQLPPGCVRTDPDVLLAHSQDKWFARALPEAVVFPRETADVATALQVAHDLRIPATARGAGYGYVGGCVPSQGGIVLALAGLNRIKEISAPDGVAVVEPGVITGELQREARSRNLFYPPDPASLKHSSIGGNIATNAGGPRCLKYGVTRQYVLGLEVVLATGEVVRLGGRTLKNKTGFDLVGLFVGSEGMLGVVTEATLRLLPLPPARRSLSAGFRDIESAASAVQGILAAGFLPSALEIADRFTLEAARRHLGQQIVPAGEAHLLVELDGQEESVRSELAALANLVKDFGAWTVDAARNEEQCEKLWDLRRGFSESLKATGLKKLNEDIAVPRGRLVDLVQFAGQLQDRFGFPVACFGHAGDGNIHVNIMVANPDDPAEQARMERALDELFLQVIAWGGAI
ncbi:MAG: FAD-binding protein, partial [Verrucomicrobia bacterium]|nr:FAD-binding protein [Verrucomicrobiota bacterium]